MLSSFGSSTRHTSTPSYRPRLLRIAKYLLLGFLSLLVVLLGLRFVCIPALLSIVPSLDTTFFDLAIYGPYPERHYHSFDLTSPAPRTPKWKSDACDRENEEGGLVLLDLHGSGVTSKGPTILDLKGNLIWTNDSFGQHAMNVKVQKWKGDDYLTFWAGNHDDRGFHYMLDSNFELAYNVSAVGEGMWDDPHEFTITPDDTAMLVVYNHTHVDLSKTHMADRIDDFIVDAVIQEIDIESGELVFQWVASEHFGSGYLDTIYDAHLYPLSYESVGPHDYFHLNSVEKDSNGNYLVSIRHTHSIICISGETGEILWGLGGAANDFEDLSNGHATDFKWQHDARWIHQEAGMLALFDNALAENHWYDSPYSAGKILHLDVENRTAQLLHSYTSLQSAKSTSQGSFQYLPSTTQDPSEGRVFIGWGSVPAYTLHDAKTEELLCETHYAASLTQYYEFAKSYRVVRAPANWTARPAKWDPSAVPIGRDLYVSWNGGMEVRFWRLEQQSNPDADSADDDDDDEVEHWEIVKTIPRSGFESNFRLPRKGGGRRYRIAALDEGGEVLRYSSTIVATLGSWRDFWLLFALGCFGGTIAVMGIFTLSSRERRMRAFTWMGRKGRVAIDAASGRRSPVYTKLEASSWTEEIMLDSSRRESGEG